MAARSMPKRCATSSAVLPIINPVVGSVRPSMIAMRGFSALGRKLSSVLSRCGSVRALLSRVKKRTSCGPIISGKLLIDSVPPTKNTSPSPAASFCLAAATASMPEAQLRMMVTAGVVSGRPARNAATRAMLASRASGPAQPRITSSISSRRMLVRSRSSRNAWVARSAADALCSEPPTLQNGVRRPATIAMPRERFRVLLIPWASHRGTAFPSSPFPCRSWPAWNRARGTRPGWARSPAGS